MNKKILTAVFLLSVVGAATGCTSGGSGTSTSSAADAATTVTTQKASTGEPTASNPGKGIINATQMESCDKVEGPVTAKGTVTPPKDAVGHVKISVSWVDTKTSAVLAQGTQVLDGVKSESPAEWSISSTLGKMSADVTCVLGATVLP